MGFIFSKPEPVDMSGPVATLVKELIASDVVVIFSKTYCPYCTMAKEVIFVCLKFGMILACELTLAL
jgi:Glutaredoxin